MKFGEKGICLLLRFPYGRFLKQHWMTTVEPVPFEKQLKVKAKKIEFRNTTQDNSCEKYRMGGPSCWNYFKIHVSERTVKTCSHAYMSNGNNQEVFTVEKK